MRLVLEGEIRRQKIQLGFGIIDIEEHRQERHLVRDRRVLRGKGREHDEDYAPARAKVPKQRQDRPREIKSTTIEHLDRGQESEQLEKNRKGR